MIPTPSESHRKSKRPVQAFRLGCALACIVAERLLIAAGRFSMRSYLWRILSEPAVQDSPSVVPPPKMRHDTSRLTRSNVA